MRVLTVFATSICIMLSFASPIFSASSAKPHVVILTTGGGISGSLFSKSDTEFSVGNISGEAMLLDIKEINDQVDLSVESISSLASQDMTHEVLYKLAQRVNALLKKSSVNGIVITHGTDTIEETAYLLNLFDAINVAASTQAKNRGVLVALNNRIHSARDVQKLSTYGTDSVGSGQMGQLGYVYSGIVKLYFTPTTTHTYLSEFRPADIKKLPHVAILYAHPEFSLSMIDTIKRQNVKGIVIAGTGNGNMNEAMLELVKQAREKGMIVVRSSRTGSGTVTPVSELNDRKLGLITGDNLSPQKARTLLMMSLTKTNDLVKIQRYFDTY